MVIMSSNVQANPLEESDQSTGQEKSQAYQEDISQQDIGQIDILAQLFGTFILYKTDRFIKVKNTFNTIKDPKLAEKLLDFGNPKEIQAIRESIRTIDKQLWKKGVKQEKTGAGFLFWHKEITAGEFDRATHATAVAHKVHQAVNNHSFTVKIQNQISRLNLNPEEAIKFKATIGKWLKENPGQSIDNALIVETRSIYRQRNVSFGKKEQQALAQQLQKDRQQAIEKLKGTVIKRGEEVVKTILDPNQPVPTTSQTHKAIFYVETGQQIIDVTPPSIESVTKPVVHATQIATLPQQPPSSAPAQKSQMATTQIQPPLAPSPSLLSRFLSRVNPGFSSITNRLGKVTSFFSGLGQKLFKNISKLGMRALGFLGKKGLGQLAASVIPGIGNVLMGIAQFLGLDEFALKAALFAVGSVAAVIIFIIFFSASGASLFSPYTPNNPMIAKAPNSSSQTNDKTTADKWKEFEKEYLNTSPIPLSGMGTPTDLSWKIFEKEYLTPQKIQLSFDQHQP